MSPSRLRGHNSAIMTGSKFHFLHANARCMSEMCSKFQISASNTIGGVVEIQTVLQSDMVKIVCHSRRQNSAINIWTKILFPLCT